MHPAVPKTTAPAEETASTESAQAIRFTQELIGLLLGDFTGIECLLNSIFISCLGRCAQSFVIHVAIHGVARRHPISLFLRQDAIGDQLIQPGLVRFIFGCL